MMNEFESGLVYNFEKLGCKDCSNLRGEWPDNAG